MSNPAAPHPNAIPEPHRPVQPGQPGIVSDPDAPNPLGPDAPNERQGDPKGGELKPEAPPSGFPEGDDFVQKVTGKG